MRDACGCCSSTAPNCPQRHNHMYERFAPQTPKGAPIRAARASSSWALAATRFTAARARGEQRGARQRHLGVLKLTLKSGSYGWEFVPVAGRNFRDSGRGLRGAAAS